MGRTSSSYRATQGLNRVSTAIKGATSSFSSTFPTEGKIESGGVVAISIDGTDDPGEGTDVNGRPTGAILIDNDSDMSAAIPPTNATHGVILSWTFRTTSGGTKFYVWGNNGNPADLKFWIF